MGGKIIKSAAAVTMFAALQACGGGNTDTVPMEPGLYMVVSGRGEHSEMRVRRRLDLPYPKGGEYCLTEEVANSTHLTHSMWLQQGAVGDFSGCDEPGYPFTMQGGEVTGTIVCQHSKGPLEVTYRGTADEERYYAVVYSTYAKDLDDGPYVKTVGAKRIGDCDAE